MGEFIALMKARPQCFTNARLILGDPWKYEPYGYCCSDGQQAFLAINNGTWEDRELTLQLNSAWGLPDGKTWDLYRWYPQPARLAPSDDNAMSEGMDPNARMALRPFEVVLLEVVPHGASPALPRDLEQQPLPTGFVEPSRRMDVQVTEPEPAATAPDRETWKPLEIVEASRPAVQL